MITPSRQLVFTLVIASIASLVLGLTTDVGLFAWSLAALIGLYLAVVAITRRARRGSTPSRSAA